MYALTVKQPWAEGIARGIKIVENRTWAPWPNIIGRKLAIHAAKRFDDEEAVRFYLELIGVAARLETRLEEMPLGAIVAVVRVVGALNLVTRETMGELGPAEVECIRTSLWASGPWCWLLKDAREIDPIPCAGRLGLWVLTRDVFGKVYESWWRRS